MRVELRPYQHDALARTTQAEARGVLRQLGVAATGLGKTIMFAALARQRGGRALILVHRDELASQAVHKLVEVWPEQARSIGVVKAERNDVHAHVVVASVQTLARDARLRQLLDAAGGVSLLGAGPFHTVIVDEAHHAAAPTYRKVIDGLRAGAPADGDLPAGPLLLGVTATPDRGDGKGLDDVFDEIVWSYDILWGIRSGFLSDVRGLRVTVDGLDLSNVRVSRGDFQAGDAARALDAADGASAVITAWKEHAADRRTLVFTPTVAFAETVAAGFRRAGVPAAAVSGETELDERRRILAAYSEGEVQVLVNCAVLTEGYDEPRTDCVVVARPTKSRALYTQMVGRGTRLHPDKTDCLVLDIVGATDVHSLVTVPSLFGVDDPKARKRLADATATAADVIADYERELVAAGRMRAEMADLFAKVRRDGIAWVASHRPGELHAYHRSLGPNRGTVFLVERAPGSWLASFQPDGDTGGRVLIADAPMELAQGVAEDFVRKNGAGPLVNANARWRGEPPSRKQLWLARKLGVTVPAGATKGEVSDMIDAAQR